MILICMMVNLIIIKNGGVENSEREREMVGVSWWRIVEGIGKLRRIKWLFAKAGSDNSNALYYLGPCLSWKPKARYPNKTWVEEHCYLYLM